jgi:hypothetical protein
VVFHLDTTHLLRLRQFRECRQQTHRGTTTAHRLRQISRRKACKVSMSGLLCNLTQHVLSIPIIGICLKHQQSMIRSQQPQCTPVHLWSDSQHLRGHHRSTGHPCLHHLNQVHHSHVPILHLLSALEAHSHSEHMSHPWPHHQLRRPSRPSLSARGHYHQPQAGHPSQPAQFHTPPISQTHPSSP